LLSRISQAFTVGIHAQIDGKLQVVLFTEGERVKKGDVLVRIDPHLFQAAIDGQYRLQTNAPVTITSTQALGPGGAK
jgi:multidrug efflux pump subunit AcrA (membrane-fusion protein)